MIDLDDNPTMIPVYDAIEFIKIMPGGTTRPWQILVNADGVAVPYVMKLYNRKYQKSEVIMREIVASVLSSEFEIGGTEAALIRITKEFVKTLKDEMLIEQLYSTGTKTKFATKLVEPVVLYSGAVQSKVIDKTDKGNIYAFDNLILHRDRRFEKPNILLGEKNFYLIDNETCLVMPKWAKSVLEGNNFDYLCKEHLLHAELKRFHDKLSVFDTFEAYLQGIANFDSLAPIPGLLEELHHPHTGFYDIWDYLQSVKSLSSRFVNHLRLSIR